MSDLTIRRSLLALLMSITAGCITTRPGGSDQQTLPTPFTAEQIRAANPPGTRWVFLVEVPGESALRRTMHFLADDGESATFESSQVDTESAEQVGGTTTEVSAWSELRDHSLFATISADRREATASTAAGEFECWLYTVHGESPKTGEKQVNSFYFAHELPGPPVLYESRSEKGGTLRMELIEHHTP